MRRYMLITLGIAFVLASCSPENIDRDIDSVQKALTDSEKSSQTSTGNTYKDGGLLFAHMKDSDYGSLYYYISKDGAVWTPLNDNKKVHRTYRGHPDIIKGGDGRYYMISGKLAGKTGASLFVSDDLINWSIKTQITAAQVFNAKSGYTADPTYFGAPKLFYDEDSDQYIITWHATHGTEQDFTKMKTLYVLTSDFKKYTAPEFLFDFQSEAFKDIVTIDTIIRKINGKYWAIYKDERYPVSDGQSPSECPTGKTVLISTSDNLTGPWTEPSSPVTPMSKVVDGKETEANYHEAPAIAPAPDGKSWYIWAELYPKCYYRYDNSTMAVGGWTEFYLTIPNSRHGCMVRINQEEYDAIVEAFGPEDED